MARNTIQVLGICLGVFLVWLPLFSQANTGRILGSVTDQSGGVMPGVTVNITDMQRGATRLLTTDEAGDYAAPNLLPGTYTVRVEAKGFQTVERRNFVLEVGKDVRVDFSLQPGEQTQTITVTEAVPMLETTTATLGGTLSNQTINDLPLNGRNYENLLELRPGIVRYPGGGFSTTSTNGLRPEGNVYILDGQDNSEPFSAQSVINAAGVAGDAATILPIDSIQEFNVQENPKAEYGWKPGAVVNVGLKSGTNNFHGTAYAFGRDSVLDARNYFNKAPDPKTPVALEQFGATVGGPIKKEKLFYFGGYEGQRYTVGNSFQVTSPVTVALAAPNPSISIPDAEADLAKRGVPLSALSVKVAGEIYPINNGPSSTYTLGFPNVIRSDNAITKLDYHINERHTLSGEYFLGDNSGTVESSATLQSFLLQRIHTRAQVGGANWIWTPNSRWVNETRFGYDRLYQPQFSTDHNVPPANYGLNTGVTNPLLFGLPQIQVSGSGITFTSVGGGTVKTQGPDQVYQLIDHFSYLRGKHAFKFGGEIRRGSVNQFTYNTGKGAIRFGSGGGLTALENFLAGVPNQGRFFTGNAQRQLSMWSYAGFLQDDWRVSAKLTVNLGVRYELNTVMKEAHNLLGNFDPNSGLVQVGQQIKAPYRGDHNNFAPRLGLAWDPTGHGKTVIRAGGSIIYDVIATNAFLSVQGTPNASTLGFSLIPTGAQGVVPGGGTIQAAVTTLSAANVNWNGSAVGGRTIFPAGAINCAATPCDILAVDRNLRTPYVSTWSVNVQRAFTNNLSLDVAYVGNHATKLLGIQDINQVNNQSAAEIACGHCEAIADRPYGPQFPFLRFINFLSNVDFSNYNGAQVTLTQRTSQGLSFIAGYTYSHALDEASSDRGGFPMDSTHPRLQYASSDYDIRHRLTLSLSYAIPGKKSFGQFLQGWQLNSILTLHSGQPWNVRDRSGNDISRTGENADRWNYYGNPADFTSQPTPVPFFLPGTTPPTGQPASVLAVNNPACTAKSPSLTSLQTFGCYVEGNSVMVPPAIGTFGTMGRNIFRDGGFSDWDLSVTKNWKFRERLTAQFRAEFFNILNRPEFANPTGGSNGYGQDDPSASTTFGCGCATPDVAASNPVIGSGGNRRIQLGLKLIF